MPNSSQLHHHHHEMRAFALYFGSAIFVAAVLRTLIAPLLPAPLVQEYNQILWTSSFLTACGIMAWVLERNRQRQEH